MAEISGSLASIELAALVHFLVDLGKSGDLLVTNQHWIGQLSLDRGRLVGAAIDEEAGPAALEFLATGMYAGAFEFSEGPPTHQPGDALGADALAQLDRFALPSSRGERRPLPDPAAVPRLATSPQLEEDVVSLERAEVYVLLAVDGKRNVRDIAAQYGLLQSVKALGRLAQLGLIDDTSLDRTIEGPLAPTSEPELPTNGRRLGGGLRHLRERFGELRSTVSEQRALSIGAELGQAVLITAVLVLGIRLVVQNFRVEGVSMQPTFQAGQILVVNRAAYFHLDGSPVAGLLADRRTTPQYVFGGPQRGDVAVFRAPPQPDTDYIKRIIGLPGDSIAVRGGRVYVNGVALSEPYIEFQADYLFPADGGALTVPADNYFVLGDNRPESLDSHFGWFVPVSDLIGRAWIRYWPPNELGVVQPARPGSAPGSTEPRPQARSVGE
jgi:signal peptidase I